MDTSSKTLSAPPRQVDLLSRIIILHSNLYALGAWVMIAVGTFCLWLYLLKSDIPSAIHIATVAFGGFGIFSLVKVYREGIQTLWLMQKGTVAYGKLAWAKEEYADAGRKLVDKAIDIMEIDRDAFHESMEEAIERNLEVKKASEPQNIIMDYVFKFQDKFGATHTVTHKVKYSDHAVLEDEPAELVLYNEQNPKQAIVYDAIVNAPDITASGHFGPAKANKILVVIFPSVVIFVNIILYVLYLGEIS